MKKFLIVLGILCLICVNCAFADTVTVYDTINNAVNNTDVSMGETFTSIFQDVIDWVETPGNIPGLDFTTARYIIYPTSVLSWDFNTNTFRIIFNLSVTSYSTAQNSPWNVISVENTSQNYWFGNESCYYDLAIGMSWNTPSNYEILREENGTITATAYTPSGSIDGSNKWCLTYEDSNGGKWLVANEKTGLYNKYGVVGSIYYSDPYFGTTTLPCYNGYYAGYDTRNWSGRYILNADQRITPISKTTDYGNNSISSVTITDNSIVVEGSDFTPQQTDGIDNIWNGLKGTVTSLIALLTGLGTIFRLIFSWLPNELVGLISSLLIFCGIYLVIKALRGG